MGDPGERGERDRRKRLHHVGTYQPNFPGRVPQIQVAVEDDLGLQPRGAFIVLLPSHPDVTARIPTAAHVHRYPRCLCSSASPGNSCEGIGKNSRVWFFRLGVPVPHKRKYLHKRNECVQGPARGVVFEHRNGALNWSTLAGELCVSRRGRQFVDSSWSCSRTVTGGAAWYTNYRACCSSPESFRGRPEDSTTPFRPTDNFSLLKRLWMALAVILVLFDPVHTSSFD